MNEVSHPYDPPAMQGRKFPWEERASGLESLAWLIAGIAKRLDSNGK
jgi:hypothetical protein